MIFVFGSNLAGRHGAGAALHARFVHGARLGQGEGLQGQSYGIPTKDGSLKTLPLSKIQEHVNKFIEHARQNPKEEYHVTAIGTGLAGYSHRQIAPLFKKAPKNCRLPKEWLGLSRGNCQSDIDCEM